MYTMCKLPTITIKLLQRYLNVVVAVVAEEVVLVAIVAVGVLVVVVVAIVPVNYK